MVLENTLHVQDLLGVQSLALIEDPQRATLGQLMQDAAAARNKDPSSTLALPPQSNTSSQWIARAPITIKLRLFCLPYAGGVSENVFARQVSKLPSAEPFQVRDELMLKTSELVYSA